MKPQTSESMDLIDRSVLVTGGAGLIGSFVVEKLVDVGAKVTVVDDFSKGLKSNLERVKDKISISEGDLEDPAYTNAAFEGAEVIFHLASRAYGVGYSAKHHVDMMLHNERVTNNFIASVALNKPDYVLAASSSCIYRDDGKDCMDEAQIFEGEPEGVNWGYGWAKRFLEQKLKILSQECKTGICIVRPFNIYGERSRWVGDYSGAIPMLVKRVLDDEDPMTIWGSGNQRRNYLHAEDCARIMVELVTRGHNGLPVNIGTEDTLTLTNLVRMICDISGREPNINYDLTKPEGRFIKSSDSTRLKSILGDVPLVTISMREGISRMLDWYRLNFGKES